MESKRHILVVEDKADIRAVLVSRLSRDFIVHEASTVATAIAEGLREHIDVAIVDVSLDEGEGGLEAIRRWRAVGKNMPVLVVSGSRTPALAERCYAAGADAFIEKPYSGDAVTACIANMLRRARVAGSSQGDGVVDGLKLPQSDFYFGEALIAPARMMISFPNGVSEELKAKDVALLHFFASNAGKLVTREAAIYAVWGADANLNSKSLETYLSHLRTLCEQHEVDFSRLLVSKKKVGWYVDALANQPPRKTDD